MKYKPSSTTVCGSTEAEFLDVIGTKVLRLFLVAVHCHLTNRLYSPPPPPLSKSGLKLVCNVNIVYRNLKPENFQDYAQKPHCMFMNSASYKLLCTRTLRRLPSMG